MTGIVYIKNTDALKAARYHEALPPLQGDIIFTQGADEHWHLLGDDGRVNAHASIWWHGTPPHDNHHPGLIGHWGCVDAQSATLLLEHLCSRLRQQQCTLAVGPMDGSTWRRYRFITDRGDHPPFFLEPDNPDTWPHYWEQNQFEPFAVYTSGLNTDLNRNDPSLASLGTRLKELGIHCRAIDMAQFEQELKSLFELSLVSFKDNLLYSAIEWKEFYDQYRKLETLLVPELTLLAEKNNELGGFVFAVPDLLQKQRGEKTDTVIIKTVAVKPSFRSGGLGSFLVGEIQRRAAGMGFHKAIHALMHQSNRSRQISHHYAETIRTYTLYAKPL